MKHKTYIRLFLLILVVCISFILFAYSRHNTTESQSNNECGKCVQKKAQTEFILWESLTRNLLSINH